MKKLSAILSKFIVDGVSRPEDMLDHDGRRIFRSLKMMGERSTKGREIDNCLFEVVSRGGAVVLSMVLEGRHSMSVCNQVARRFDETGELEFAEVTKTKNGAKLAMKIKEQP